MIISILGNNIDTNNIYQVTPIEFVGLIGDFEEDLRYIPTSKEECTSVNFTILMFNKKKLEIKLSRYEDTNWANDLIEERLQKVTKLREELIKIWSNNQSSIPKLEFQ